MVTRMLLVKRNAAKAVDCPAVLPSVRGGSIAPRNSCGTKPSAPAGSLIAQSAASSAGASNSPTAIASSRGRSAIRTQ